jgi:hypothetical protein
MKTSLRLTVAGDKKGPYLTKMCSATMQNERIVAFPRQQWLRERYAVLRYTYTVSVVIKFCNQLTVRMTQNSASKINKMNPLTVQQYA